MFVSHRVLALTTASGLVLATGLVTATAFSSQATEGSSLIAGARNVETSVTTIARSSAGPALRLQSGKRSSAPMTVNSTGWVRNLNVDRVDGRNAAQLLTRATEFRAGATGDELQPGALWSVDVEPGIYNVSMRAILNIEPDDPDATAASVICGVLDLNTFNTPNTRVYVADSAVQIPGGLPAAMSGAATIRIGPDAEPGGICITPNGTLQLFKPVIFSFGTLDHRGIDKADPVDIDQRQLKTFTPR
jgi:hypothetical protein